jgi:hypothetical protein
VIDSDAFGKAWRLFACKGFLCVDVFEVGTSMHDVLAKISTQIFAEEERA